QANPVTLEIFSGEIYNTKGAMKEIEEPGEYYCPLFASLITAAGRCLLAMAEACVKEQGGTWMAADTDSAMVVANENGGMIRETIPNELDHEAIKAGLIDEREFAPIPALSHAQVEEISRRFESLNPYSFPGT